VKILVDIDGTLNHFDIHFAKWVDKKGYTFDYDKFMKEPDWNIENFIIGEDNPRKIMDEILVQMEFWMTIPPINEAIPILRKLNNIYDISIVTVPWKNEPLFREAKYKWLDKHFGFLDRAQVVFSGKKDEITAACIIDDKPATIEKCNSKMATICFDHPYNRKVESSFRTNSWNRIPKMLREIRKLDLYRK
jgi:5'(3')-deoxyribonucleotidase